MAWYERHTNQRSINGGPGASNYVQNGSWIVDHFSKAGSRIMTQFFDDHVVPDPEDRSLLAKVGKYGMSCHFTLMFLTAQPNGPCTNNHVWK